MRPGVGGKTLDFRLRKFSVLSGAEKLNRVFLTRNQRPAMRALVVLLVAVVAIVAAQTTGTPAPTTGSTPAPTTTAATTAAATTGTPVAPSGNGTLSFIVAMTG